MATASTTAPVHRLGHRSRLKTSRRREPPNRCCSSSGPRMDAKTAMVSRTAATTVPWIGLQQRNPGDGVGEGIDNAYPQSPLTSSWRNRQEQPPEVQVRRPEAPKTNAYFEFKRGSGLSSTAKLTLVLNLRPSRRAAASVLVFMKNGTVSPFTLGITSAGTARSRSRSARAYARSTSSSRTRAPVTRARRASRTARRTRAEARRRSMTAWPTRSVRRSHRAPARAPPGPRDRLHRSRLEPRRARGDPRRHWKGLARPRGRGGRGFVLP